MAQVIFHSDEMAKEGRALSIIQAAIHDDVFIKILNLDIAKDDWDKLKEEFQGSERTRRMLNLRREFEAIKMKEAETVKEFVDRLSKVVTQIRLLGEELSDQRVVEKILVCLPERFESKISSLEENKDFSHISISELVNALQATEQRISLRMEENFEGSFMVNTKGKFQCSSSCGENPFSGKKLEKKKNKKKAIEEEVGKTSIHLALTVRRRIIYKFFVVLDQKSNAGHATNLVMWRKCAKAK
uniref:Retrovirus-related Pol polyprotein from transposon TNT 1-94 n=1 Tax=Cajanus cajan TaxID=3821 RepID=A0A151R741_CAJCA|nr:hypothetical protein KK1_040419 [Cajanus cajan]